MFTCKLLSLKNNWVGFPLCIEILNKLPQYEALRMIDVLGDFSHRVLFHCIIVPVDPDEHTAEMFGSLLLRKSMLG